MKKIAITLVIFLFTAPFGCRSSRRQDQPLKQCLDDLNSIPVMAAVLASSSQEGDSGETRPLEGMQVAVTINGMILSSGEPEKGIDSWCEYENSTENFNRIVEALEQNSMPPAVAFVSGLYADHRLLRRWVESGNLLGNSTFSRRRIKNRAPQAFIQDCARGEEFLAPLLKGKSKYFRYPRLKASENPLIREQIEGWLKSKGYSVVWATIDAPTDKFTEIYCAALSRGDQTCASFIKECFKKLLLDSTLKARAIARRRAGREVKHIMVIKANQFMCDILGEMLSWYKGMGAEFISIDEAMRDPVYATTAWENKSLARSIIGETRRRLLRRAGR